MSEHTPGPWHVQTTEVSDDNGRWVANFFNHRGFDEDTMQANARLIAAAPDLLAALQEMVSNEGCIDMCVYDSVYIHNHSEMCDRVRAAIAKAKGTD